MAMRVPELQQQFLYESPNVPTARLQGMQVQTSADMFGAQSGRQMEKAGYLLQRAADQTAHLVDDYNNTKAREAASAMQQDFLAWQTEAAKKVGKDGASTGQDYDAWAQQRMGELTKGMSTVQRGRFESIVGERMALQKRWAEGYGQEQDGVYKTSLFKAEMSGAGNLIAANPGDPDMVAQAMKQIDDAAYSYAKLKGLDEKAGVEFMREAVDTHLGGTIHNLIQQGQTGAASNLMQQYGGQLGGAAVAQLGVALKREQRAQAREAWAEAREARITARIGLGQRVQDATASYQAGAQYDNAPSLDEFIAAYGEEQGAIQYRELEGKRTLGEAMQDLRGMTQEEQQAALASSRPAEGEGFAAREKNYKALASAVQHDAEARTKDPVLYVTSYDPSVKNARANMLSAMTPESVNAYTTTLQASLEARGMAGTFQKQMPLLTEQDARHMAADLASSTEPEKKLAGLQQAFGKNWPALERQLTSGEKLPPDMSIVASGMQGRPARLLLDVAKNKNFVNDAKVALGPDYRSMQDVVGASLQDALKTFRASGATAIETRVRDSTEKLAAAYMWQDGMSVRDAAKKAAQDVISERYTFKGTYRVPKNIDADRVDIGAQREITRIAETAAALDLPAVPGLSKEAVASRYGSGLLRNATWATNEDESGLILFVGSKPIRNADGSLVRRSWDELREASHPRTLVMTPQAKATLEDMKFEGMQ